MREVDPWLQRELRRLHPGLRARWDRARCCFVVEQLVRGEWWWVMSCTNERGDPIEPGEWVLTYLRERDTWRMRGGYLGYIHHLEERAKRMAERRVENRYDDLRQLGYDMFPWIQDELDGHAAPSQFFYIERKGA